MQKSGCDLQTCFLCRYCIPEWKELLAQKKKTLLIRKGKKIIREGDTVDGLYFMYEGSAKLHTQWGEQKDLIIRFAKKGDVIGLRGWGEANYSVSATALTDCKLCFINSEFLESTLQINHGFTYQLMHLYSAELQKAEKRMRDLAHREVKGRIALAIFEMANVFGVEENNYLSTPVTRQDIASYAGTSYETVFKLFTELINKNILSTSGKNIKINDHEKLQSLIAK